MCFFSGHLFRFFVAIATWPCGIYHCVQAGSVSISLSQRAPSPPEFAQPGLSRSNGGHPQREGTNLGVFVSILLVLPRCDATNFRSRPSKPNQRKGQNEKFMNFAQFCEFWCFSLGKQARFTLNFCSGMPPRKVHELTFLWFGLPGPLLKIWVCLIRVIPTQTGLCKFGWVWSSLINEAFLKATTSKVWSNLDSPNKESQKSTLLQGPCHTNKKYGHINSPQW